MSLLLLQNDARQIPLRDGSVSCICTSPPYFNLRQYEGTARWHGGDIACRHQAKPSGGSSAHSTLVGTHNRDGFSSDGQYRNQCLDCGAVREDAQIGLEKRHDCLGWATGSRCGSCYLCVMVAVFTECYRILRNDGVMFVIIGDSYAAKNLCGIPQRLALALQADGWYWRSEIIWSKGNAFPESVTDRPTKSHEQVLMFTKQERYFWNQEAVREPHSAESLARVGRGRSDSHKYTDGGPGNQTLAKDITQACHPNGRNIRDVWHLNSEPTSHAHYATFPTELVSRCIRAGSPETCCGSCGAPWRRVVERDTSDWQRRKASGEPIRYGLASATSYGIGNFVPRGRAIQDLTPQCSCTATPVPSLVYDPFSGSGTTLLVARQLGRHGIGSDLSWPYLQIARSRLGFTDLALWEGTHPLHQDPVSVEGLPLFQGLAE